VSPRLGRPGRVASEGRLELVAALSRTATRIRGYGDLWNHCPVASGSTDVAVEAEIEVCDLAAVKVVVEAASGRFTDLSGDRTASGGSAVSSNGRLHDQVHDQVLEVVRATAPRG
jgi:histidinol-phosphatase